MAELEKFRSVRGTVDVLPDAYTVEGVWVPGTPAWRYVEEVIREVLERYGFEEIRTPILEHTELIARGVGELTDIVTKEMFAFQRGDTHYVLRPELTAPVMRAYLQHRLEQRGGVQKLYYMGACFRAERPQRGRYRQFHQFGAEIIGSPAPEADVEVIAAMMQVYDTLGVRDTLLRINTLGDARSRAAYREALRAFLAPHVADLTETSRRRLEVNPLRILDTKVEQERALLAEAPRLIEFVDEESLRHYEQVKAYLRDLGIAFVEDPFLVRGLDYYTRTAFELEHPRLGAQSALAGGGRYDLLAQELGSKQPVPAVGFAAGMERLFLALAAQQQALPEGKGLDVFIVALGEEARRWAVKQAFLLRQQGVRVGYDLKGRSLKAQMREANRKQTKQAIIVGERELKEGKAVVKDMESGAQEEVPLESLHEVVTPRVTNASNAG